MVRTSAEAELAAAVGSDHSDSENIIPLVLESEGERNPRRDKFNKVKDSRGRVITGLWERNGRFYGQLRLPGKGCRKVSLLNNENQPVDSVQAAAKALYELRRKKDERELPASRRAPLFKDYIEHYLSWLEKTNVKKPKTIEYERWALRGWANFVGNVRLNDLSFRHINEYIESRCQEGLSPRTVNLGVIYLRNCLGFAKKEGWFPGKLPTDGWEPLPYKAAKRPLFTKEQLDKICAAARQKNEKGEFKYRNGEILADAIRFMRASGARVTSALATHWSDVDWENKQVHLRKTKYDKQIVVDFNPELEAVLQDMYRRRLPDSVYMFPGTRKEGSVGSLRKTFELVREEAGVPNLRFHDLRHHFASYCVISGVDFVTVANWLGHADTSLLGKTYAHLSRAHAQRAAQKVSFEVKSEAQAGNSIQGLDLSKLSALDFIQLVQKLQNPSGSS